MHTCIFCYSVPSIWQRTAEQQSLHITGFLRVTYAILNASVILERNEKRLERNETHLTRNETRGGNLLLIGTVTVSRHAYIQYMYQSIRTKICRCHRKNKTNLDQLNLHMNTSSVLYMPMVTPPVPVNSKTSVVSFPLPSAGL